jgi:hypothetical protein
VWLSLISTEVVSHKIQIISLRGTPQPAKSGAPDEFKRLATSAQEMLRLGRALDEVLFALGQATHFAQDLNQPLHAAWGETRTEHNEIEAQMLYRAWQKDHRYRGFILIKNYTCFAYEIAQNSSQYARALFFDREIRRVTEIGWDQAVNDTAYLWQSTFWNALGPERAWQVYGILARVKEIGNGAFHGPRSAASPIVGSWPFKLRRASIFVRMTNRVRRLRWRSIISLLTTALILTGCARGVLDVSFLAPTTNTDGSSLTDVAAYRVYYGTAAAPCPGERAIIAAAPKVPLPPDQPLEVRLTRLTVGQLYYVAVTAVNSRGIESACTNTESARARRP